MTGPAADAWLATCEEAAFAGGRQLLEWRGKFRAREKARADLVTDADWASQDAIRAVVARRFPEYAFVGEEHQADQVRPGSDQMTWLVDPLDGTTNYVHGYPHFAVSVALARGGSIMAGAIFDPVAERCFAALAGRGAWCNRKPIQTSATEVAEQALVAVSLPASVARDSPDLVDLLSAVQGCQAVRRSGSAALNLAYLASGALDAFWATQIHPWDVAAGVLLVREAGGIVTARNGCEFDLWNPNFLATCGRSLHDDLGRLLAARS